MPRQSSRNFVPPPTNAVKKSPSIKEYINDAPIVKATEKPETENVPESIDLSTVIPPTVEAKEPDIENPLPDVPAEIEITGTCQGAEAEKVQELSTVSEEENILPTPEAESFEVHWSKVVDTCFQKLPTVYYSLKEYLPEITNQTLVIKVRNMLQKEQIEEKTREIMAYLRNHYDNSINGMEVLIDEELETKVKILDNRDKLNILNEQNNSLPEFMKILNLVIKE
mgnify:CR=1 FL=1